MAASGHDMNELCSSIRNRKLRSSRCCDFGKRHVLAAISCCGFAIVYGLRVNLSVALVAMVNNTEFTRPKTINATDSQCPDLEPKNSTFSWAEQGEFSWGPKVQGIILGAFFYGYVTTQLIGGYLADRIGGKWLFGVGILVTSVLTIVTPFAARSGPPLLIAVRVIEGIGEGVTFPAMYSMWSRWAPRTERSTLTAISYAGSPIGTIIAFPISGLMCEYGFDGGWPSVFYVFGSLGCVWFLFWCLLVHNTPESHPSISNDERYYILSSIGHLEFKKTEKVPWKSILTSCPVITVCVVTLCAAWGNFTLLTCIPTYMKEILKLDMTQNGMISALPYILCLILSVFSGWLADHLIKNDKLSITTTRKVFTVLGLCLPSAALLAITQAGCNRPLVIAFLIVSVGGYGLTSGGISINQIDLAPKYAGMVMGLSNTFGSIPGITGPFVAGVLTDHYQSRDEWNLVFIIAACINVLGAIVYVIFGSGLEQSWATPKPELIAPGDNDDIDDACSYDDEDLIRDHVPVAFDSPFQSIESENHSSVSINA